MVCELSASEKDAIQKFVSIHKHCVRKLLNKDFFSTTGGQFSYIITPTGLGECVAIRCNVCGKVQDITDTSDW